ncbi:MAG: amidohydrolase family protein [Armatimonadia bacterium]
MTTLIDPSRYQRVDLPIFEQEFADFLPERVYDAHVHVALPEHTRPVPAEAIADSWASEAPHELSLDQLAEVQQAFFPRRATRSLVFTMPTTWFDIEAGNAYVASGIAAGAVDGLLVTRPEWPAEHVHDLVKSGGFLGFKPYPGLVGSRSDDTVTLSDYFPPAHQELADALGLIVLLHLPRPERLRDPRNQAELHELVALRPNLRLIVAHIGRSYTMSYAEPGLAGLRDLPHVYYDFAMNLNPQVLELALREVGAERLLYGSDLPICLMRGVREYDGDSYINFSDENYTWNTPDRRKSPDEEAQYTFYLYEELRAFKWAAQQVGLSAQQVAQVMGQNAERLVAEVCRSRGC